MKWTNKGHEYDSVKDLLVGKTHCYIYGAGWTGGNMLGVGLSLNKILGWTFHLVDRNKDLQGIHKYGVVIEPLEALEKADKDNSFVIICNGNDTQFTRQTMQDMKTICIQAGFESDKNIFLYKDFYMRYLSVHLWYQHHLVYLWSLNICPSTVCNLNCKGCLNFNPYIKQHTTYSLEEVKENVDALFESVDLIGRFQVTGGEPMLYPNLKEIVGHIGKNYRNKMLEYELVMNSTRIPSDELVEEMLKYNMLVYLDDYTDTVPESRETRFAIVALFLRRGVRFVDNYIGQWFSLVSNVEIEQLTDEEDLNAHFTKCHTPYTTLENKSISACNYSLYAQKAGLVGYCADDYFQLPAKTDEEKIALIEFRNGYNNRGYVELCKKCKGLTNIGETDLIPAAEQIPHNTNKKDEKNQ